MQKKILNKRLANRIQKYIKRIMHSDHIGYILEIQDWINISKALNIIYHINKPNGGKSYCHINYFRKMYLTRFSTFS